MTTTMSCRAAYVSPFATKRSRSIPGRLIRISLSSCRLSKKFHRHKPPSSIVPASSVVTLAKPKERVQGHRRNGERLLRRGADLLPLNTDKEINLTCFPDGRSSMQPFAEKLPLNGTDFRRRQIDILQVNMGRYCNQACIHCHAESGPTRKEMMRRGPGEAGLRFFSGAHLP